MKTIPPVCPEPETGRKYWASLDQLADTPEFRQWVEREFPSGASEFSDPVSRRNFVRIMSASFLLAGLGLTGCRRPVEQIHPFAKQPEDYIHGVPQFFATAMPRRSSALPLVVKSTDGRPTKIEGNPDHPDSNGGTDLIAQASVLTVYDPDRAMEFKENGQVRSRQQAFAALGRLTGESSGRGVAFLLEHSSSPSRARMQQVVAQKLGQARWFAYEPVDLSGREAATRAFGRAHDPYYKLDEATTILSLDCDFIGNEENAYANIRKFTKNRKLNEPGAKMNRLYTVEGLFTLTGLNSDHRIRVAPSLMNAVVARVASELGGVQVSGAQLPKEIEEWLTPCIADLKANRGKAVVMPGHRLSVDAQVLVMAINNALGAIGPIVEYRAVEQTKEGTIQELAKALNGGEVETLVILGGNPVYNAPAELDFAAATAKAKNVIRLSYYEDESSWNPKVEATQWDLPMAHYLESWGDARTADGTLVPIQPLIEPLFDGVTEIEVLATIAGEAQASAYEIVTETFGKIAGKNSENWKKFLHDGFLADSASKAANVQFNSSAASSAAQNFKANGTAPTRQSFDVVFHRDYKLDDGRYNNNGWLQELPDPITKLTWDNAILMSPATAKELNLIQDRGNQTQQWPSPVVEIELNGRKLRGPVWVQPGMADYTVGLALGYGRLLTGRVGRGTGYNAYALRTSDNLYYAFGAKVNTTADNYVLATTQSHWQMEGRPVVREAYYDEYQKTPDFVKRFDEEMPEEGQSHYENPLDVVKADAVAKDKPLHAWGMSIDLNSCVGCSTCVVACQSENNIPIVGKEMVGKSREMHWLRIDRYFAGPPENPQAVTQPMLCQHCEAAPCENVCPVNATTHDDEGLNVMVYNRCVGTRYCSNNCPYKVRRFNFFDWNRHPLTHESFYTSPIISKTDGEWDLLRWFKDRDRGYKPEDEFRLVKMVKNPDVTVRMRGVMEKCSFCVQRLESAKIAQKVKARDTAYTKLSEKEGTMPQTACQQACPAGAIVFGDTFDPESTVSKLKKQQRNYTVLEFLNTRPRLTYLAKVRNPNPEMPDYKEHAKPYSTEDYLKKAGEHEGPRSNEMDTFHVPPNAPHGEPINGGKGAR
jgi:MoCo/4Fe-4S cofactor protein with predicted Tat translocation signal